MRYRRKVLDVLSYSKNSPLVCLPLGRPFVLAQLLSFFPLPMLRSCHYSLAGAGKNVRTFCRFIAGTAAYTGCVYVIVAMNTYGAKHPSPS